MKFFRSLVAALLPVTCLSAQAVEVEFDTTSVRGVSILSADIARGLESAAESLVVRLRNEGEASGQALTLAVMVHDKNGSAKGLRASRFEIDVPPSGVQVSSQPVPSIAGEDDILVVELIDIGAGD